jgi:hypothetical protein
MATGSDEFLTQCSNGASHPIVICACGCKKSLSEDDLRAGKTMNGEPTRVECWNKAIEGIPLKPICFGSKRR